MSYSKHEDVDYTAAAAKHLRETAAECGMRVRSSHAHALVAAYLGYNSRAALLAPNSNHCVDDQWLGWEAANRDQIRAAIARMRDTELTAADVDFVADSIRDGLTPACCESGRRSAENIPLGDVQPGDETEWVHPSAARDTEQFGHCRCCGRDVLYRAEDLDDQGVCEMHHGEFDCDPEEQQGWDDLVENLTKDG